MTTTAKIEELQKSVINAINNSCLHPAVVRLVLLNVISMVEASGERGKQKRKRDRILKICFCSCIIHTKYKAIPHNSKCRYGERGAADAKPKAQIILMLQGERRQWRMQRTEAGAAVAECEGAFAPKHDAGTATRHYRAFWQRRCRAAAAGAVLKPQGGNCAVLP